MEHQHRTPSGRYKTHQPIIWPGGNKHQVYLGSGEHWSFLWCIQNTRLLLPLVVISEKSCWKFSPALHCPDNVFLTEVLSPFYILILWIRRRSPFYLHMMFVLWFQLLSINVCSCKHVLSLLPDFLSSSSTSRWDSSIM